MRPYLVGSTVKLPLSVKLLYGWGDLFGGGALNLVGFYYLIFLTDVVRINPAWAGLIILLSKAWDAVSDPMMGLITDRTRSRWGRRRPWFMVSVVTIVVSLGLLWFPPAFQEEAYRFLFALFGYLFFATASTVLMVPYLSMMPTLARDYNERTSLNAVKMGFSFVAGIIAAIVPMKIVAAFPDIRHGYAVMGLVFGLFYAVPWIFISIFIKEPDSRNDEFKSSFRVADFLAPFKVRSFRYLAGIYLGAFLVLDLMSSLLAYYMTYVLGRPGDLTTTLGILIVCQLVSLPLVTALSKRLGKNRTLILAALVWIASVAFIALSPVSWPSWVIYVQAAVTGFGVCGSLVMPWTMYPDTVDVGTLALGRDCAGSFSGLMTFFRKMASALALFMVGLVLQLSGYVRPTEELSGAASKLVGQAQPDSALLAIRLLLCLAPLALLALAIVLAARTPLVRATHSIVRRRLSYMRGESQEDVPAEEFDGALERLV
jgi:oligogalacturonide transporter